MHVFDKIIRLLDVGGLNYEVFEHPPVFTSEEAARIRETEISQGAKALVLLADGNPLLAVLPGDLRLNTKKLKKYLGAKDLRFATPEKVKEITTIEIGAIPPVGKALNLKSYFSDEFLNKKLVSFNAGYHEKSIMMVAEDLIKMEDPVILSIT